MASLSLFTLSLFALICLAFSQDKIFRNTNVNYLGDASTFPQLINHFQPQDKRTFAQRYWVLNDFYTPGVSPILLYICGEATCSGIPGNGSYPYQVAQKIGALLVAVEHRYYGLSQPFGADSMKTESLKYLSVEQGLADLAYFIMWFKGQYALKENQGWITIGGSYAGAMSAWFRYKYPHLTLGAWASSGVVNSILNFTEYDYQIWLSASRSGIECPNNVQNLTKYFEYELYETTPEKQQEFKARFGPDALKLSNDELLWYIADCFVLFVQYGKRETLCTFLQNNTNFDEFVNATIQLFLENNSVKPYGTYFVSNTTFDPANQDLINRQWNYQVCSQLGWFQVAADNSAYAMRSSRINLDFYKQWCKNAYGISLWPDTDLFNDDFGGVGLEATNVILSNGSEDPWQWATKNTTTGSMTAVYISCEDCGHCVDFHGVSATDPYALQEAHVEIEKLVKTYLGSSAYENIVI